MFDTATLVSLNDLRGRVLRGEHVSDEELHEALKLLAQGRAVATVASNEKRKASKPLVVASGQSLLERMAANIAAKRIPAVDTTLSLPFEGETK
jgi:hypothetical protein